MLRFQAMRRLTERALQVVLNTDASAGDLRDNLSYIYGLYVEYVMKNPLYTPEEPFRCMGLLLHERKLLSCEGQGHEDLSAGIQPGCQLHD